MGVENPVIFISYSWSSEKHKDWVRELAERLTGDGIEVKLDIWDLKEGQDKYHFMETMVKDERITKVLMICDKKYKEKADNREGGVGTETQIITPELYEDVKQEKFIPIIAESSENYDDVLPMFLKSRIFIDLSNEDSFEDKYETLIRNIHGVPLYKRPEIGEKPDFSKLDKTNNIQKKISNIEKILQKGGTVNSYLINEFIEEFLNSLNKYEIKSEDFNEPYDEIILSKINEMFDLKNYYFKFLDIYCNLSIFDINKIIYFFEEINKYAFNRNNNVYNEMQFDHYKFLIEELFIYTSYLLVKHKSFIELNELLNTEYHFDFNDFNLEYTWFNYYIYSLDDYMKRRNKSNKISITANIMINRTNFYGKNIKNDFIDTDLLLHYISLIKNYEKKWIPRNSIYRNYMKKNNIIKKIYRKSYFEEIKVLFGVDNVDQMIKLIKELKQPDLNLSFSIPPISSSVDTENIAKK